MSDIKLTSQDQHFADSKQRSFKRESRRGVKIVSERIQSGIARNPTVKQ
jgi:hypothetical protein